MRIGLHINVLHSASRRRTKAELLNYGIFQLDVLEVQSDKETLVMLSL